MLTFGSLFSGIGGIDLGLERAGMKPLWMCEKDLYARKVLKKHWPDVPIYEDVCKIDGAVLMPNVLCGGFPCQDLSSVNWRGKGLDGEKSGLWFEFYRIICLLRPKYVFVENVPTLLNRGLDRILGQMAKIGYDAEWQVLSAAQFGAPHLRKRLFLVAYPQGLGRRVFHSENIGKRHRKSDKPSNSSKVLGCDPTGPVFSNLQGSPTSDQWKTEPSVGRVVNGVSSQLDRLRCLGNAVVPQVAEYVGTLIIDHYQK